MASASRPMKVRRAQFSRSSSPTAEASVASANKAPAPSTQGR